MALIDTVDSDERTLFCDLALVPMCQCRSLIGWTQHVLQTVPSSVTNARVTTLGFGQRQVVRISDLIGMVIISPTCVGLTTPRSSMPICAMGTFAAGCQSVPRSIPSQCQRMPATALDRSDCELPRSAKARSHCGLAADFSQFAYSHRFPMGVHALPRSRPAPSVHRGSERHYRG
jgi:hypothetical protein